MVSVKVTAKAFIFRGVARRLMTVGMKLTAKASGSYRTPFPCAGAGPDYLTPRDNLSSRSGLLGT